MKTTAATNTGWNPVNGAGHAGVGGNPQAAKPTQGGAIDGHAWTKFVATTKPINNVGSLPQADAMRTARDIARGCGVPNVAFESAEGLMQKFPEVRQRGLRHDAVFAVDPNSDQGKQFYKALDEYCRDNDLAIVGIGMVSEFSHSFCFAPVTEDGNDGKLLQMDASIGGSFYNKKTGKKDHTRIKQSDPNNGKTFTNQIRALWLVPRDVALLAGNSKYNVAKDKVDYGVNCAEMTTGLLHHMNKLGLPEFKDVYAANRAYRKPTGPKRHRGFAAGMVLACPHIVIQHTNDAWQGWATDEKSGAGVRGEGKDAHMHTKPLELSADYQF